jgi:hypothetical protein
MGSDLRYAHRTFGDIHHLAVVQQSVVEEVKGFEI